MATGYTCILTEKPKTTFKEFTLRCARAFGALIHMRDDGLDVPVPETVQPMSTYHKDALEESFKKKAEYETMTVEAIERAISNNQWMRERTNKQEHKRLLKEKQAFESMLEKVRAWQPPTPDHEGLKKFMIEQLEMSLPSESTLAYYPAKTEPYHYELDLETWRAYMIKHEEESIEYHQKKWEDDLRRASESTVWLQNLLTSLK